MKKEIIHSFAIILCVIIGFVSCSKLDEADFVPLLTDNSIFTIKDPTVKSIVSSQMFAELNDLNVQFYKKFSAHCATLSKEEISSVINLGALYKTDRERYGVLLEEKLKSLLKDDYDGFCTLLTQMKLQSENLDKKFNLLSLSKEHSSMVLNRFSVAVTSEENIVMRSMMSQSSESTYNACVNACTVARDTSIDFANKAFGCAAGVGALAWCAGLIGGGMVAH